MNRHIGPIQIGFQKIGFYHEVVFFISNVTQSKAQGNN